MDDLVKVVDPVILPESIRERVEQVIESTRDVMAKLPFKHELMPITHIFSGKKLDLVASPFANDAEKEMLARFLKRMCRERDADLMVFMSESWTVGIPREEIAQFEAERARGKWASLSEHPKAVEIVMFNVETRSEMLIGVAPIVKKDLSRSMGEISWRHAAPGGRFSNILCERSSLKS